MISVFEVGNHETTQLDGCSCFAQYRFFSKKKKKFHSGTGCSSKETVDCPATTDFLPRHSSCVVQIMYVRTMITTILTPTANTDFLLSFIRFSNSSKQPVKL